VKRLLFIITGASLFLLGWFAHPVCVPLSAEDLKNFNVPIEQRTDRDIFFFKTFQKRNGQWCQCKSWLSREMFF